MKQENQDLTPFYPEESQNSQTEETTVAEDGNLSLIPIENRLSYNFTNWYDNLQIDLAPIFQVISETTTQIIECTRQINFSFLNSLREEIQRTTNIVAECITSPLVSALQELLSCIAKSDFSKELASYKVKFERITSTLLQTLYDSNWFPLAGWHNDIDLFEKLADIIVTNKGTKKRKKERIDSLLCGYFTKKKIKEITLEWNNLDFPDYMKKMLKQSINAYMRGERVLTLAFLTTLWEGMFKEKCGQHTKEKTAEIIAKNGYDKLLDDFYQKMILATCYCKEDLREGIPSRHGTLHSWYTEYPSKKTVVNAILFTDFLMKLKPITQTEETSNGTT